MFLRVERLFPKMHDLYETREKETTHRTKTFWKSLSRLKRRGGGRAISSSLADRQHEKSPALTLSAKRQQSLCHRSSNFNVVGYTRVRTLGKGTYGKVVLAVHHQSGEYVAMKCIKKHRLVSSDDRIRMEREVALLKHLRHDAIAELYDLVEDDRGTLYLVLEYASRGELFDYIVAKGRLEESEARDMFEMMARAVEYCHMKNVVHRGLKPENFLLDENHRVKLIDFGFSHYNDSSRMHDTYCGSPAYAAPEMLSGQTYKGALVDVWSLGIILFAMVCGHLPFDDICMTKMYVAIVKGNFKMPEYVSEGNEKV
jgi:5'-AMP-activated protein kinase, catalytic alpha subunit